VDDVVNWKESSKDTGIYAQMSEDIPRRPLPGWLTLDPEQMAGRVLSAPEPTEIDTGIDVRLVVEHYSR
jgi:ribosomal protein S4